LRYAGWKSTERAQPPSDSRYTHRAAVNTTLLGLSAPLWITVPEQPRDPVGKVERTRPFVLRGKFVYSVSTKVLV
jgi:hypothetical protein